MVVDGQEGKYYDRVAKGHYGEFFGGGSPVFSPDSRRVGYVARGGIKWFAERWFVVVDGQEGVHHRIGDGVISLVFSPDSQQVAYKVQPMGDVDYPDPPGFVVVDGHQGKKYTKGVGSPVFSPDSKRLAYSAGNAVIVDGHEQKQYGDPYSLVFSPDSQRLAYMAVARGRKWFVVVDGQEGKQYEEPYEENVKESLLFSPDSQRVGYVARAGEKWFVVMDGLEGEQYDYIEGRSLVFSPDSQRLGYVARGGGKWFVVVNGREGSEYDGIVAPSQKGGVVFDSPDQLHYMVQKDNAFYLVEERLA